MQKADTVLRKASGIQQELAVHPENFSTQSKGIIDATSFMFNDFVFPETTERIFTSSIETFNTISNVNFINEVSSFYIIRHKYKDMVLQWLNDDIEGKRILSSVQSMFDVNFPEYVYMNWSFLQEMKDTRDRCVSMMDVSEKELEEFSRQHTTKQITPERKALMQKMQDEMIQGQMLIMEAQKRFND